MTEQNLTAMEEQLARLQEAIAAKRATEGTPAEAPVERSEVHAALGEQLTQEVPGFGAPAAAEAVPAQVLEAPPAEVQPAPVAPPPAPIAEATEVPAGLEHSVQELVTVAFTEGPSAAIGRAMKTGNAALVDALHDVMADQFHQELLKRQKVAPAP